MKKMNQKKSEGTSFLRITKLSFGILTVLLTSLMLTLVVIPENGKAKEAEEKIESEKPIDSAVKVPKNSNYSILELTEKKENYVLELSKAQWKKIAYIELQAFLDDGEGYIALGHDNVYDFDKEGNLKVQFDKTWIALNGNIVSYYAETESRKGKSWSTSGYVPARLNDKQDIDIMLYWDEKHPNGYVKGYRLSENESSTPTKKLFSFKVGDAIKYYCDYYTYDIIFDSVYYWGDGETYGKKGLTVSYEEFPNPSAFCFRLQDIYNHYFWTEYLYYD